VKRTPNTITDPELLKKEIDTIRCNGYAYDMIEHEESINMQSPLPYWITTEWPGMSVSIAGPADRMTDEAIEAYKEPFLKTMKILNDLYRDFAN
jgi:DNA-binding IclR family transcriptional regulator